MKQFRFLVLFIVVGAFVSFGVQFTTHGDVGSWVKQATKDVKKFGTKITGGVKGIKEVQRKIKEKGTKLLTKNKVLKDVVGKIAGMTTKGEPMQNAYVRQGNELCAGELEAVKKRAYKAKNTIYALTENPLAQDYLPAVGIAASGGGYRAMIAMMGFLKGLKDIGMIDTALYASILSGSTWGYATLLSHGFTIDQAYDFLRKQTNAGVSANLKSGRFQGDKVLVQLAKKALHQQKVTLNDLYGALLASSLLEGLPGDGQKVYLEDQRQQVESGNYPFPIYTAVEGRTRPYEWYEFTPYEIGGDFWGAWIKPETFGRRYMNGKLTGKGPRQTLGYCLGIFGSAFGFGLGELFPEVEKAILKKASAIPGAQEVVAGILNNLPLKEISDKYHTKKPLVPMVRNPFRGMDDVPFDERKSIKPVDAGLDINVPFPPLLRRGMNLIIVCDASGGVSKKIPSEGGVLVKTKEYAERKGYKFPEIDDETSNEGVAVKVFYDENDPEVPIVVYFPNQHEFPTTKFQYTNAEFDKLADGMYKAVTESKDILIEALNRALEDTKQLWDAQAAS